MNRLRRYLAGFLVLALIVTSQGFALARTADGPAGAMVICTGSGPVTVLVDGNGQPTGAAHVCPDCVLGLFAVVPPDPLLPVPAGAQSIDLNSRTGPSTRLSEMPDTVRARAPPLWT